MKEWADEDEVREDEARFLGELAREVFALLGAGAGIVICVVGWLLWRAG